LSNEYRIAETKSFLKSIKKPEYSEIYSKIKSIIYSQLKNNPHYGHNIKKLKGEFQNIYRYRISDYRLFYINDDKKKVVFVVDLHHRKEAYK